MLLVLVAALLYTGSGGRLIVLIGSFRFVLAESRLEEAPMARNFANEYPAYRGV